MRDMHNWVCQVHFRHALPSINLCVIPLRLVQPHGVRMNAPHHRSTSHIDGTHRSTQQCQPRLVLIQLRRNVLPLLHMAPTLHCNECVGCTVQRPTTGVPRLETTNP